MKSLFARPALPCLVFIACMSCTQPKVWESEFQTILENVTQLDESYAMLNGRVDSLWDATTDHLSQHMPADLPPIEADIFLKSRNADHMRMFMSFKMLDSATQAMVNEAGEMDKELAKQIQEVQQGRQRMENVKLEFLKKVEEADAEAYEDFRQKFVAAAVASGQ